MLAANTSLRRPHRQRQANSPVVPGASAVVADAFLFGVPPQRHINMRVATPVLTMVGGGAWTPVVAEPTATTLLEPQLTEPQQALLEYVVSGPLASTCGLTPQDVKRDMQLWLELGKRLAVQLGFDHENLQESEKQRIFRYYLPVFFYLQKNLKAHKDKYSSVGHQVRPLVVGLSAPQGCGKTALVGQLEQLFTWLGQRAATVSIDDFYHTYEHQNDVASSSGGNSLLQYRGNAGTHDLDLGIQTLMTLRNLNSYGQRATVPRYDKSAYQGRGDRAPREAWPEVHGPLDIILLEGWMLGFRPIGNEAAASVHPSLAEVDRHLSAYKAAWDTWVDTWLVIRVGDPDWVYKWRCQAEERMIQAGKSGMTKDQVEDFVSRFMPAYKAYLPGLYRLGPTTARAGATLIIEVDEHRAPKEQQPAPVSAWREVAWAD